MAELEKRKHQNLLNEGAFEEDINILSLLDTLEVTSNPLTWEDIKLIWNITDEMDNMPEEEFYKEVLNRFKAQKGEEV